MGEQLTISEVFLLWAASNNPHAVVGSYYMFDESARNRGLCPHVKNRPLLNQTSIWLFYPALVELGGLSSYSADKTDTAGNAVPVRLLK